MKVQIAMPAASDLIASPRSECKKVGVIIGLWNLLAY